MAREKENYRLTLADLLEFSGGKRMLTAKDVGAYLGIDARTAKRRYQIECGGIAATVLASIISR